LRTIGGPPPRGGGGSQRKGSTRNRKKRAERILRRGDFQVFLKKKRSEEDTPIPRGESLPWEKGSESYCRRKENSSKKEPPPRLLQTRLPSWKGRGEWAAGKCV